MSGARRSLLIVDDEELFARAVADELASPELEVERVGTAAAALAACRARRFDVVLLDQQLPDGRGAELCPALLEANEATKIVFVTAHPSFDNALAALRGGAFDYVSKPCELEALRLAVGRSLRTLDLEHSRSLRELHHRREAASTVVVGWQGLAEIRSQIELAARVDSPVLLTGETGTGKSLVARAIHFASRRREGELVAINCAALPESLIEAELFGYERGAFTGAAAARAGLLEMAEGGTLLLDEIGEMPSTLQTRLLHVLEGNEVRRLGGHSVRRVDFRAIAATNADLDEALRSRRLREDLYYRLAVLTIHLPPLRQRQVDLPELVEHFLRGSGGAGHGAPRLAPGEIERLAAYEWPGNLRELRNVLERAVLVARPDEALAPSRLLLRPGSAAATAAAATPPAEETAGLPLAEVERRHIQSALRASAGNLARAARALGISLSTLKRRVAVDVGHAAKPAGASSLDRSI